MWKKEENRREFFENYAAENGIDPLLPDHWFSQPREKILAFKVIIIIVICYYYNNRNDYF